MKMNVTYWYNAYFQTFYKLDVVDSNISISRRAYAYTFKGDFRLRIWEKIQENKDTARQFIMEWNEYKSYEEI